MEEYRIRWQCRWNQLFKFAEFKATTLEGDKGLNEAIFISATLIEHAQDKYKSKVILAIKEEDNYPQKDGACATLVFRLSFSEESKLDEFIKEFFQQ